MKEQTVFKVVAVHGQKLVSAAQRCHQITYIPKIWIKPKIGKIFVFKSRIDARAFVKRFLIFEDKYYQIWKAVGINVSQMEFIACSSYVTSFWNGHIPNKKYPKTLRISPPDGTLVVDKIKLLKKMI